MTVDSELELWRREWQSEAPAIPPDLRDRVRRESRFLRWMLAGEILVTLVMGGVTTGWAIRTSEADVILLAVATWIFLAAAWTFGLVTRRGAWSPAAESTAAFLDLSIRRCRSAIAGVRFGTVLYFVEIVFCLAWVYRYDAVRRPLSVATFLGSGTIGIVAAITVIFVAGMIRSNRRKKSELAGLLEARQSQSSEI